MNILHVIGSINIGGAETFLLRLIDELRLKGHHSVLMLLSPEKVKDGLLADYCKRNEITVLERYQNRNSLNQNISYYSKKGVALLRGRDSNDSKEKTYYRFIQKKFNFDLINSHMLRSDFFVSEILNPILQLPFVITSQGCYNDYKDVNRVANLMRHINGMTYVAEKNLNIFKATGIPLIENAQLVYNGLPKNKRVNHLEKDGGKLVLGQISRSIESKGMEVSIEAVKLLQQKGYKDIELIVIGPENDYYKSLKSKYAQDTFVSFPGVALNPVSEIMKFDIGLLPSFFPSESCPSSVVEYLSCGKPVITSDIGEIPNMVMTKDGTQAGKVIATDKTTSLPNYVDYANAIEEYYLDRSALERDSDLAFNAFNKFDISLITDTYLKVYENAVHLHQKNIAGASNI